MLTKKSYTSNRPDRLSRWGTAALSLSICGIVAVSSGCGGGGGGTSTVATPVPIVTPAPAPIPSPVVTPTPAPTPTVAARDRAISANFSPNYIPADTNRYLHWADQQSLRVFIHPSINNVFDRTTVNSIDPARARSAVREALDFWTAASTADFRFSLVDSAESADIEINFVDEIRRLNGTTSNGVGLANYSFTFPDSRDLTRGLLDRATVQIATNQPDANLSDTIAHEIGHALGIEVHSDDSDDLLFATSLPPTNITQRDQNTLFFLYYSPEAVAGRSARASQTPSETQHGEVLCGVR